jgi:CBS domain containing-hemolysin-like protein
VSPWLLSALAWLAVGSFAATGSRSLRRFSRSKLEDLFHHQQTRPLYSQIVERRERVAVAIESLSVLSLLLAVLSAVAWQQSSRQAAGPWSWIDGVVTAILGLLLCWFCLVWLPTAIARLWADPLVLRTWGLWKNLASVLLPSVWGAEMVSAALRRLAGKKVALPAEEAFEDEILTMVKEGEREGLLEEDAREMIEGVIELGDVDVAQIMTPRTDMVALHVGQTWDEAIGAVSQSGHSRLPVYNRSPDDVIGILHSKDLLVELAKPRPQDRRPWREIIRPAFFVPETKPVDGLLQEFQQSRNQIAMVLDEFGGVSGLVTLEDALEEIVGEIVDEHDKILADGIKPLGEHSAEALARVRIHEINEQLGLNLPEDEDYDTIGGFVFHELGRIPNIGEELIWQDVRIKVLEATRRRINRVAIYVLSPPPQPTA